MDIITSSQNQIVRRIRALREKKFRQETGLFIVEGIKFVNEISERTAKKGGGVADFCEAKVTERTAKKGGGVADFCEAKVTERWEVECFVAAQSFEDLGGLARDVPVHIVSDGLFSSLSDTVSPQGVLAIVRQRLFDVEDVFDNPLILMLDGINDPGNLGSILRLAQSVRAGVLLSEDCVDLYNPKAVRSAAGSFFHLRFAYCGLEKAANMMKARGIKIFAAMPHSDQSIYEVDFGGEGPCAILVGNEARGVSARMAELACERVKIPMIGEAESLNAGMACGIVVYEVLRRRLWMKEGADERGIAESVICGERAKLPRHK